MQSDVLRGVFLQKSEKYDTLLLLIGYRSSDLGGYSAAVTEADELNSKWMPETLKDHQPVEGLSI